MFDDNNSCLPILCKSYLVIIFFIFLYCLDLNICFCRMKKRSLAGNVALGLYVLALVFVFISFFSTSWLVSDGRITGIYTIFFFK